MEPTNAKLEPAPAARPFVERRQRKADPLARALRYLAVLIYPLLAINFFIFMGVASEDQKLAATAQNAPTAAQQVSSWVSLYAYLPIMVVGLVLGGVGLFLSRKRARRRYDYKVQNQLILVVLSVVGLILYFVYLAVRSA